MIVIVGLGNPGSEYSHTRHNVGWDIVDVLSQRNHIPLARKKCKSIVGEGMIAGKKVVLAQPQTFMNLSGEAVVQLREWYKPEEGNLLICYDDCDLSEGVLRFREKGSAGTHNGMRNSVALTGTTEIARLRCGIGRPPERWDLKDWVLCGFRTREEREMMFDSYMRAGEAIEAWIADGPKAALRKVAEANARFAKND